MFDVNRGYGELVERINIERIVDNENLPCDVIRAAVDDDNKHLPYDVIDIVVSDYDDEIITYLVTVSYTHLDVYKRQRSRSMAFSVLL